MMGGEGGGEVALRWLLAYIAYIYYMLYQECLFGVVVVAYYI
jgi:hypothetical protein